MPAIQDTTIVDLQRQLDEYRAARDAALSEKAGLAEELAARDAALAQRDSEFSERIEHQSATIDVLKAMSASPGDAQPVFDLIVRRAVELCNAQTGGLLEYDGERVHVGTIHGLWEHDGKLLHVQSLHGTEANIEPASLAAYLRQFPMPPKRGSIAMRAILDCQIVHIRDMRDEIDLLEDVQRLGHKSQVSLPLLRDAKAIGVITIAAHEPGGFSESQIELLKTFAEQAVIAISSAETYRALQTRTSDLQESLEYQTATSEVLKVISGSDFELEPAFQAVVETATRLCHADQAIIYRYHDGVYRWAAGTSLLPDYERIERSISIPPGTGTLVGRVALERRPIEILDALTDPLYEVKDDALVGGIRTLLGVPLMRDGSSIGVIGLARQRVEAFTERQIELVKTFADQAVIAIENARLLTEQREALERQTAMAEVLQVINALPGNLKPVFDAILERAMRLCGAAIGGIYGYDGRWFHPVALRGVTPAFAAFSAEHPVPSGPNSAPMRILRTKRPAQVPDLADGSSYSLGMVDLGGIRSLLDVPLLKENNLLGFIAIYREEAGTFPDKQIALLEDFAAQAVIAMENARLLTEQREALEQQTATAEVLGVINANPGNLVPVFDAILQKAHSLCAASMGSLVLSDGYCFRLAASHGIPEQFLELGREPFPANTTIQRLIDGERLCHIQDVRTLDPEQGHEVVHLYQYADLRTGLIVPLRKDAALLGYITAYRREVRLFSEKEIALLESFAAQAVIAMENARLLNEQREALERQTATADILATINANPGDPRPVYETILTKAHALCGAVVGGLLTFDGTHLHTVAANGYPTAIVDVVWRPIPLGTVHQPMIAGERCVHVPDVSADPVLQDAVMIRAMLAHSTIRTLLLVPLRKDGAFVGQITAWREGVQPFAENEIALLESFAARP